MLTLALTAELGQLLLAAIDFCIIHFRKSIKKREPKFNPSIVVQRL